MVEYVISQAVVCMISKFLSNDVDLAISQAYALILILMSLSSWEKRYNDVQPVALNGVIYQDCKSMRETLPMYALSKSKKKKKPRVVNLI